jgi:hypothetical protein
VGAGCGGPCPQERTLNTVGARLDLQLFVHSNLVSLSHGGSRVDNGSGLQSGLGSDLSLPWGHDDDSM